MDYLKEAKEFFANDKYATDMTGITIDEVTPEKAVCSFTVEARHLNAMGIVMGGAIFTLADFTFGVAANASAGGVVSMTANIVYTAVCKGKRLIATAECEKAGRRVCTYTVHVEDELGTKVAVMTATGFRKTDQAK